MNRRFFGKKAAGVLAGVGAMLGVNAVQAETVDSSVICNPGDFLYLGYEFDTKYHKKQMGYTIHKITHRMMRHNGSRFSGESYHCDGSPFPWNGLIGRSLPVSILFHMGIATTQ